MNTLKIEIDCREWAKGCSMTKAKFFVDGFFKGELDYKERRAAKEALETILLLLDSPERSVRQEIYKK